MPPLSSVQFDGPPLHAAALTTHVSGISVAGKTSNDCGGFPTAMITDDQLPSFPVLSRSVSFGSVPNSERGNASHQEIAYKLPLASTLIGAGSVGMRLDWNMNTAGAID